MLLNAYKMVNQLYLQPPSLGEFLWVAASTGNSERDVTDIFGDVNSSENNLFKAKFRVPDGVSPNNLDSILKWLEHENLSYFASPKLLNMYNQLAPEMTLTRGRGDCKSRAILTVTCLRKYGRQARFYLPSEDHVVVEENVNSGWMRFDPGRGYVMEKFSDATSKFDNDYEEMLKLFQ